MSGPQNQEYIGGVPIEAFIPNKTGIISGGSGEQILYKNTDGRIELRQGNFHCIAFINNGYFRLDLETKQEIGNDVRRSTDLFAELFSIAAHEKFIEAGYKIKGFKAVWLKNSDNFNQFQANRKKTITPIDAAKLTWSGRLATRLGYTHDVKVDNYADQIVEALFT